MRATSMVAIVALLGAPAVGRAALGGLRDSIDADRRALGGEARPAAEGRGFRIESFDLHGTTVREFVRADGRIFALAWEGLIQPDLETLLGHDLHARPGELPDGP